MSAAAAFWLNKNCVRHPRISGGVAVLLRHMNAWLKEQHQVQCDLERLTVMLECEGLPVIEAAGTLLVPGFGLKEDIEWLSKLKPASRSSRRK